MPAHVSPKSCFVFGTMVRRRPLGGSYRGPVVPADRVAHEKGIRGGGGPRATEACAIRVSDAIGSKSFYTLPKAKVGDIWTNLTRTHCGIVYGGPPGQEG